MNGLPQTTTPKKFLFVSFDALINDMAWQVIREGHEAKYFIESPEYKDVADGFVPKTDNWEAEVGWADIIVFDDTLGFGEHAKRLREQGKLVIGGTPYTDRLEDDRAFGQEELKRHGVSILSYQNFTDFGEGIAYIRANPGKYVLKPSASDYAPKGLLFIGNEDDGGDTIRILTAYQNTWSDKVKAFQLQKKVTSGVEVAVGAFFNGEKFLEPINVNFEHKKLFPGDLGVSTGDMGNSMFWSKPNALFNATLKNMEPTLQKEGYVGYIDINCIVNGQGIYPLEFTCRFGYPTLSIQAEGIQHPMGEFFWGLATKELTEIRTKKGFQIGAYIVVPPFPFDDPKTFNSMSKNMPVVFQKPMNDGVYIFEVKLVEDEWLITGASGVVLTVTGTGNTMREAQRQMYNRIGNIIIPNMYYRTDIGDRWFEDNDRLHTWGYLRENGV